MTDSGVPITHNEVKPTETKSELHKEAQQGSHYETEPLNSVTYPDTPKGRAAAREAREKE